MLTGMSLLGNRVGVVTGASSGIGRGIARKFAAEGADVVVADIREEPKSDEHPTHELIEDETDQHAVFVKCDVSSPDAFDPVMAAAEELGGLDIMVNNAGIWRPEEFLEVTEEEYTQLMDINMKGVYFGSQAAAKRLIDTGGGNIINISSINGIYGNADYPTYSVSKAGVRVFSYSLAHRLGEHGIRVNAIHPGAINTNIGPDEAEPDEEELAQLRQMIPLERQGEPEDVAGAAVFLASELGSYVSGASLLVDGGWTNWR